MRSLCILIMLFIICVPCFEVFSALPGGSSVYRRKEVSQYKKITFTDENYESLLDLIREGRDGEALEEALGMIEEGVEDARIYNVIGDIYNAKREFRRAIPYLESAIDLDNCYAYANYNLAFAHQSIGFNERGLDHFSMALRYYEKFFECYDESVYEPATVERDLFDASMNAGYAHFQLGYFLEASRYFERAVGIRPYDGRAIVALSIVSGKLGRFRVAFSVLRPVILEPPRYGIHLSPAHRHYRYYQGYFTRIRYFFNFLGFQVSGSRWVGPEVRNWNFVNLGPYFYGPCWGPYIYPRFHWERAHDYRHYRRYGYQRYYPGHRRLNPRRFNRYRP